MTRVQERVLIPQDEHPGVNFVGLLIGPRGNTLKKIEKDHECKVMIRGKGSVKVQSYINRPLPGEDEPLHALIRFVHFHHSKQSHPTSYLALIRSIMSRMRLKRSVWLSRMQLKIQRDKMIYEKRSWWSWRGWTVLCEKGSNPKRTLG